MHVALFGPSLDGIGVDKVRAFGRRNCLWAIGLHIKSPRSESNLYRQAFVLWSLSYFPDTIIQILLRTGVRSPIRVAPVQSIRGSDWVVHDK